MTVNGTATTDNNSRQHNKAEFEVLSNWVSGIIQYYKGVFNMIITTRAKIFGELTAIGKNGLAFRLVTSVRKAGKQSDNDTDNYVSEFYDAKTFNPEVVKAVKKALDKETGKFAPLNITAYYEINCYKNKAGEDVQKPVLNITKAEEIAPF